MEPNSSSILMFQLFFMIRPRAATNRTTHNDLFELLTSNFKCHRFNNTTSHSRRQFFMEISLTNPSIYQEQIDISYVNTNLVSTYNSSVSSNYRIKNNSLYNDNAYDARSFFSIEVDNSNNKIYQPVLDKVE